MQDVRADKKEWLDRKQLSTLLMIAATAIGSYLCYLVVRPFLASLVWAVALAVLGFPTYKYVNRYIKRRNVAAGLITFAIAALVIAPFVYAGRQVARELWTSAEYVRGKVESGEWRGQIERTEWGRRAVTYLEQEMDVRETIQQGVEGVPRFISGLVSESAWFLIQLFVAFLALFFFFRDQEWFVRGARDLIPLKDSETSALFKTISETLYATVFGEILIAVIQGVTSGLLFWAVGLPAPFLWGFVIGLFGFLPAIGGWMIWFPAAVYLMLQGELARGIVLLVGGVAVNILTTMLYPVLVGERLRLHTLIVFVAIVGGIMAFGMVGIILGPMVIALTISLIHFWRERMDNHQQDLEASSTAVSEAK